MRPYIPFTYLIGWKAQNVWYYGVKYAKGCHPDDLWTTYFTSSRYVKEYREFYGEPDVIEVRHTFTNDKAARKWEDTVFRRLKVVKDVKWLNRCRAGVEFFSITPKPISEVTRQKMSLAHKGRIVTDETRKKLSKNAKGKKLNLTDEQRKKISDRSKNKVHTEEVKQKISAGGKGLKRSDKTRKRISEANKGKVLPEEVRQKLSDANKGKIIPADVRKKISISLIGIAEEDKIFTDDDSFNKCKTCHCVIDEGLNYCSQKCACQSEAFQSSLATHNIKQQRIHISKEDISKLFNDNNNNLSAVARILGCKAVTVSNKLRHYGLYEPKKTEHRKKKNIDVLDKINLL